MSHVDKPDRLTISGVHRGEQRTLYDARRDTEIPAHGLRLVAIRPADLDADSRGCLRRNPESDITALHKILAHDSDEDRVTDAFRTWLPAQGWTLSTSPRSSLPDATNSSAAHIRSDSSPNSAVARASTYSMVAPAGKPGSCGRNPTWPATARTT
ncbi:hypothetical protein [Streptomyces sp. NPDC048473]|uniref:hypothetical protein n=1 Tax=Streptomyces sp. NPDC048473 TaxID=3365556 RepID=UPI003713CEE6